MTKQKLTLACSLACVFTMTGCSSGTDSVAATNDNNSDDLTTNTITTDTVNTVTTRSSQGINENARDRRDHAKNRVGRNDFKNKKLPCLRCFFQEAEPSDDQFNCETEGILGTVAGIVGTIQANEILKKILGIGKSLNGYILILNLLDLNFRKVKINKNKTCICNR